MFSRTSFQAVKGEVGSRNFHAATPPPWRSGFTYENAHWPRRCSCFLCEHLRELNTFGISEVSTELGTSMFVVSREVPRGDYANSSVENDIDDDMAGRN